jgi:long-chain acyl-CoA synthetase
VVDLVNATMMPYSRIDKMTVLSEPLEKTTTKKVKRYVAS